MLHITLRLSTWLRRNRPMAVKTEAPNDTKRTDRIEKRVVFRAPRTRVWRALGERAFEFYPEPGSKLFRVRRGQAGAGPAGHTGLRARDAGNAGRAHRSGAVLRVSLAPL